MKGLLGIALAGFLALGVAGSAGAATLSYSGSLTFWVGALPGIPAVGGGLAVVNGSMGGLHVNTLGLAAGAFGPVSASLPVTSSGTINSVIFTAMANAPGSPMIAGGAGPMGLTGTSKICLVFAPCAYANVTIPLTPVGGTGFGIGGTQAFPGAVAVTMQHSPWTIGTPTLTIHTPNTNVIPSWGRGFAHGPASVTSSTAQASGVIQLVTMSKTYTSLTTVFPELVLFGLVNVHFIPEPGTLLLLCSGVAVLALVGRRRDSR